MYGYGTSGKNRYPKTNPVKMKESPFVSVVVPVYNAEKYLPTCLESICNQTLRELEIIVVDDGSTDNSGRIADEYAARDGRIKVVHRRSGNPGATRNVGLELATGEYIGFIDGDDWIEPNMYRTMLNMALMYNPDWVVCGVSVDYTKDKKHLYQQVDKAYTENDRNRLLDLYFDLTDKNLFAYPVNKLYRSSIIRDYRLAFPEVLPYEDLMFNLNYYIHIQSVTLLPDLFYHYMRREELSAAGSFSATHLQACEMTADVFRYFFKVYNSDKFNVEAFLSFRKVADYSAYATGLYKRNSPLTRKERIECLRKDILENTTLKKDILLFQPKGFYQKMFYFILFHTTPVVTDSFYQFLFYIRYHFDSIYRKFRLFISR